jgi:hypothetical protein
MSSLEAKRASKPSDGCDDTSDTDPHASDDAIVGGHSRIATADADAPSDARR